MQRMLLTLLLAFAVGCLLGKLLLPVLHKLKFGQNIYELAPEAHKKKQGTPTMGGLVIAGAAIAATLVANDYAEPFSGNMLLAMLLMALGNLCIGFADDMTKIRRGKNGGLTARQKMFFQTILALAFSAYCYFHPQVGSVIKVPFLRVEWDLGILYIPIMMFIIVGTTNSANLLDGLDGLLTSVSMVDFATLAVIAGAAGLGGVGVGCAAMCGGCMAFLMRNAYPAQMFMGDTGSMFIGGAVVAAAMLLRQPLILVLIAFWMLMSSVSDIIQITYFKATHGKRVFKMAPIHHHFELCGMHEVKIVAMYMVTTAALCALTLLGVL
ncbi:MAG: phospho-N-acetylmuramoyl-pentapeptide-transferase [Clostridiales bacterium]|nr:phospho-N-acetylmuramoyl-pentapeptide-transferase [Clostridiales bacterium]MDY5513628.1 phospho-N-acetylmuramoyl-pentapeptide-transferase [Candidatus Ventricola sp.]